MVVFILIESSVVNNIDAKRRGPFSMSQRGHISCRVPSARDRESLQLLKPPAGAGWLFSFDWTVSIKRLRWIALENNHPLKIKKIPVQD